MEDTLTNTIDRMSAVDIFEGLPSRIHTVIARLVVEDPTTLPWLPNANWSCCAFADAIDTVDDDFRGLAIRPGDRLVLASENSMALAAFILAWSKPNAWPWLPTRATARASSIKSSHTAAARGEFYSPQRGGGSVGIYWQGS
jgi:long-chain acyl-CoA synthetase